MAAFLDIFRIIVAINLAIGFMNATGVFSHKYMTKNEENLVYNLTDISESASSSNTGSVLDYFRTIATMFVSGLHFIFDFAIGTVYVYGWLKSSFNAPDAIAVPLQTVVAISWFMFFAQVIMRDSWTSKE